MHIVINFIFLLLLVFSVELHAQETSGGFPGGSVLIGYDNRACIASLAGSIRYNSSGAAPTNGYFVITNATYTGNLGGLSGADAKCLTDLNANDWKGKSTASVDAAHVKAFLCDGTTCNNLDASTSYAFAHASVTGDGGGSFITDGSSIGPANTDDWSLTAQFGVVSDIWSNRATTDTTHWNNAAQGTNHCTNWSTASAGVNGRLGHTQWSNGNRWNEVNDGCDNTKRLVCMVNPGTGGPALEFCDGVSWGVISP